MKKQIVNEKVFRNYLSLHKIDENFESFLQDHKPAQVSLQHLNLDKLMSRISQLNMCKAVNRKRNTLPSSDQTEESWRKGELKFFAWTVLFYCYSQEITPKFMKTQDFEFMHTIFQTHQTQRLEFEVICLFGQSHSKNKHWSSQDSLMLQKIIKEHLKKEEKIEWKTVAYELYTRSSGKCFKGFKHCREMWINHLNPEVNRGKWSAQEQKLLLRSVMKYGCQWSNIAKQFNGSRTEHMVKNKYSSIISVQKKLYPGTSIEELERNYLQKLSGSNSESFENFSDSHSLQCSSDDIGEKISSTSGMDSEPRSDMNNIFESYQTTFEKIQSDFNRTEDSMEYFNFDNIVLNYKKVELQEVIEDVLPKLGCQHPEQLSFFFEESPSIGESWLNSYSY